MALIQSRAPHHPFRPLCWGLVQVQCYGSRQYSSQLDSPVQFSHPPQGSLHPCHLPPPALVWVSSASNGDLLVWTSANLLHLPNSTEHFMKKSKPRNSFSVTSLFYYLLRPIPVHVLYLQNTLSPILTHTPQGWNWTEEEKIKNKKIRCAE